MKRFPGMLATTLPRQELIPSMAGKYNIQTNNFDNGTCITVHEASLEAERSVWYELDKARQATIAAQEQTILAQKTALEALKLLLANREV